jgi:hypothetical protein
MAPSCTSLHTWVRFTINGTHHFCLHINFSTFAAAAAAAAEFYKMLLLTAAAAHTGQCCHPPGLHT